MSDKAIITCALTGVLTDPRQHPVPVTPEQMAREACVRQARDMLGLQHADAARAFPPDIDMP
jgi:hypothetical protein